MQRQIPKEAGKCTGPEVLGCPWAPGTQGALESSTLQQKSPLDSGSTGCPALAWARHCVRYVLAFAQVTEEAGSAQEMSKGPGVSPDFPSFLHLWIHLLIQ